MTAMKKIILLFTIVISPFVFAGAGSDGEGNGTDFYICRDANTRQIIKVLTIDYLLYKSEANLDKFFAQYYFKSNEEALESIIKVLNKDFPLLGHSLGSFYNIFQQTIDNSKRLGLQGDKKIYWRQTMNELKVGEAPSLVQKLPSNCKLVRAIKISVLPNLKHGTAIEYTANQQNLSLLFHWNLGSWSIAHEWGRLHGIPDSFLYYFVAYLHSTKFHQKDSANEKLKMIRLLTQKGKGIKGLIKTKKVVQEEAKKYKRTLAKLERSMNKYLKVYDKKLISIVRKIAPLINSKKLWKSPYLMKKAEILKLLSAAEIAFVNKVNRESTSTDYYYLMDKVRYFKMREHPLFGKVKPNLKTFLEGKSFNHIRSNTYLMYCLKNSLQGEMGGFDFCGYVNRNQKMYK